MYFRNILDCITAHDDENLETTGYNLIRFDHPFLSQTQDKFENFSENLERNLDDLLQKNLFLVLVICDFNVKSNNWYYRDKSSLEDDTVENIAKQYRLHQAIKEPTHILHNTSSCIDLIFTSQLNLITESGVHLSLHPNCHHQIAYAESNL